MRGQLGVFSKVQGVTFSAKSETGTTSCWPFPKLWGPKPAPDPGQLCATLWNIQEQLFLDAMAVSVADSALQMAIGCGSLLESMKLILKLKFGAGAVGRHHFSLSLSTVQPVSSTWG